MKNNCNPSIPSAKHPLFFYAALIGAFTFSASAQYAPPPSPVPFPGFLNEYLRKSDPYKAAWDIGGSFRVRYEIKDNAGSVAGLPAIPTATPPVLAAPSGADFRENLAGGADNDNSYLITKLRARVGYTAEWYNFLVEGRNSTSTGDDRNPNVESDGPIDLHQAYFFAGNHKEFPVSLKVGRQELSYGEERIIGAFAWNNIGRVFDAAKVRWQNPYFAADFFTSKVVIPDDNEFNMSNEYDWFSGMYGSTKLIPNQTTEFYALARNTSAGSSSLNGTVTALNGPPARDIYTLGIRMRSNPNAFGPWDYGLEVAGQFGHFNEPTATIKSQEHMALFAMVQGGYTWTESSMTPRVGAEYAYASGDSDPTDGEHGTFEMLFPTKHKFYGYMDLIAPQNLHDVRLIYTMKPMQRLSTAIEYHAFWLDDTNDGFYNAGGVRRGTFTSNKGTGTGYGINPTYDNYLGSEIDFIVGYALTKYAALEAGYCHFFAGSYIEQSMSAPTHGSADADYVYLQATLTF